MKIKTVGVVGAGVIGRSVAQSLAQSGYDVILADISSAVLESARLQIRDAVRAQALFSGGRTRHDAAEVLRHIEFFDDLDSLTNAEFIIENVTEKWETKRSLFLQIDQICTESCVFAANTSAISITRIGSCTSRPDKVIGIHFMNPVPLKSMVEVIRGYHTSDATIQTVEALLTGMGKEWIIVKDSPGFVSNRILMLMINEAIYVLQEQLAAAEDVDRMFTSCFGHKMGPLATADLIGLDTVLFSIEVLHESFADSKYRPCPLLKQMVDAGLHGRKSGQGFYNYRVVSPARE